jgi:LPXTG-motif cell wall-anchored protein
MAGTITVQGATPATTAPPATAPQTAPAPSIPPPSPGAPAPPGHTTAAPGQTATAPAAGPAANNAGAGATAAAHDPQLPHTGSRTSALAVVAAAFVLAGATVVISTRRRSRLDPGA